MSSKKKIIVEYWDCSNCHGKQTIGAYNMWWTGTQYQSVGECQQCEMIWLSTRKLGKAL